MQVQRRNNNEATSCSFFGSLYCLWRTQLPRVASRRSRGDGRFAPASLRSAPRSLLLFRRRLAIVNEVLAALQIRAPHERVLVERGLVDEIPRLDGAGGLVDRHEAIDHVTHRYVRYFVG